MQATKSQRDIQTPASQTGEDSPEVSAQSKDSAVQGDLDDVIISDDSDVESPPSVAKPPEPSTHPESSQIISNYQIEVNKLMAPGRLIDPSFDLEKELRFLTADDDKEVVTNHSDSDSPHQQLPTLRCTTANYYKNVSKDVGTSGQPYRLITFTLFENKCAAFSDTSGFVRVINMFSNTMTSIPSKNALYGDATALQFTPDFSLLIIGHAKGDLRVFETRDFSNQILVVSKVLENPVSSIQPLSKSDVVAADAHGNVFVVQIKRGYLLGVSAEYERVVHLQGNPLNFLESALLTLDSDATIFLAGLRNTNSISLFEVRSNKSFPVDTIKSEDGFQIQTAVFNMQRYAASSSIVFGVPTSRSLFIYELLGRTQSNEPSRYVVSKLASLTMPDPSLRTFNWLNEFTFSMFTENCESIFLVNFSALLIKDTPSKASLPKRNWQIEKDFLPPAANFRLAPIERGGGTWLRVSERSFKPKCLSLLSEGGMVLTISLRMWRDALQMDLDGDNEDWFFKNFLRILYGKYTFFNDFIFDPAQRRNLMNAYFCEKVARLFDKKFYVLVKNIVLLFEALIEMNSYEFLLYNVRKEFDLRGQKETFDSLFETAIEVNRISRVPSAFVQEICNSLVRRGKTALINSISLRVDPSDPSLPTLAAFCLDQRLYFSYLFLQTITYRDDFVESLQLLFHKAREELGSSPSRSPPDNLSAGPPNVNSACQILLWFPHRFLRRDFFGREYDFADFELFLRGLFVVYFNPSNAKICFRFSWKESLKAYESFFIPDVFMLLKSEELLSFTAWEGFVNSFPDILGSFSTDLRQFCEFYLTLSFDLRSGKLSEDPDAVFRKVVDVTRESRFLFKDFLSLVEEFVIQFKSFFSEAFSLQFADLLASNCLEMGAPTVFLESLMNVLIELGLFESLFLLIGQLPRDLVKGFIFDFIDRRVGQPSVRERFVIELKYFLLMNASRTFKILHKIAGDLDLVEVDAQLASFPDERFLLYQQMLDQELPQTTGREFLNKYFGLLAFRAEDAGSVEAEGEIVDFIQTRFSVLDFWESYRHLHHSKLFLALGALFEGAGNFEKAFIFYFYALRGAHGQSKAAVELVSQKLLEFLDFQVGALTPDIFALDPLSSKFKTTVRFSEYAQHGPRQREMSSEDESPVPPVPRISNDSIHKASLGFSNNPNSDPGLRQSAEFERKVKTASGGKITQSTIPQPQKSPLTKSAVLRKRSVSSSGSPQPTNRAQVMLDPILLNNPRTENTFGKTVEAPQRPPLPKKLPEHKSAKEKSQELATELRELGITVSDFLSFCGKDHSGCLTLQTTVLAQLMTLPAPPQLLKQLWELQATHKLPIHKAVKRYFGFESHMGIVLGIFRFEFSQETVELRRGTRLQERCHVCRRNIVMAEELDSPVVIAKPECGHIFHKECYLRKFNIDESTVQGDVFAACAICGVKQTPSKAQLSQSDRHGRVGGRTLMSAIQPIGSVVTGTASGIKWFLDSAFAFGGPTIENTEGKRRKSSAYIQKKSMNLIRRQTTRRISRISNRADVGISPVDVWLSQLGADGVASRFDAIIDDRKFGGLPDY